MTGEQRRAIEALIAEVDEFHAVCVDEDYTDTGELWLLMDAAVKRLNELLGVSP